MDKQEKLIKILMTEKPSESLNMLKNSNQMEEIIPELRKAYTMTQNKHHNLSHAPDSSMPEQIPNIRKKLEKFR